MKTSRTFLNFLVGSALLAAVTTSTHAATKTWIGTSNNWGTGANWNVTGIPAVGDDAVFTSTSPSGYNIYMGSAGRSIKSITFDSTTGSTPYTINLQASSVDTTARTLTLGNGGAGGITVTVGNHTIKGAKLGGGNIGDFIMGPSTVYSVAADSTLTFDVRISSSATSNHYTKSGLGTLTLNADNGGGSGWALGSFSVSQGVLQLAAVNAFGNSGNDYTIDSGAAMEITGGFGQTVNNGTITLNGTGIIGNGALRSVSGNNTISGTGTGGIILGSASSIGVDAGQFAINQAISGGFALTKVGAGTLVLGGSTGSVANTYSGGTTLTTGTLQFSKLIAMSATGAVGVGTGTTLAVNAGGTGEFTNATSGNGSIGGLLSGLGGQSGGTVNYTGDVALGIDTTNAGGSLSYGGVIGNVGTTLGLTKLGAGSLTVTNTNTYTGATNITQGTLSVSGTGSINSTTAINVAAGASFVYNSSTALTVAPTLNGSGSNKATFSGTGTINAAMVLDSVDDVVSPGNSPGTQMYGTNQTWSAFSYDWEINDWNNTVAGTNTDQIQITGSLDLSAASSNQYLLNILSLNNSNASGLVGAGGGNVFIEANRSWSILTTTGGITGFDASEWQIVPGGFQNTETGTWSVGVAANDLVLTYTVIPEPRVALLGGLGLLALLRRRR